MLIRTRLAVAVAVAAMALPASASVAAPSLQRPAPQRAVHLVGLWRVLKAGEKPGTTLVLGSSLTSYLTLLRPCGQLDGEWEASNDGQFVGMTDSGDGHCFETHHFTAAWLRAATGDVQQGRRIVLTDQAGATVAVLKPESSIPKRVLPNPKHDSPIALPKVTARTRKDLSDPVPLPAGVVPATPAAVIGSWTAAGSVGKRQGYAAFRANNNWRGSDGCNGYGGRYAIGAGGRLLELNGPSTDVACDFNPAPDWVDDAARVGTTDTGDLELFNRAGKPVGTLVPKAETS